MGCPDAELSVVATGDDEIQQLNRDWRGKNIPTDVLSFSQIEALKEAGIVTKLPFDPTGFSEPLGDVVISYDTAERQAERFGNRFAEEVERLLIHGVLHLLGHDHVHGGWQARRMKEAEAALRAALES